MCEESTETAAHLILHCNFAKDLWAEALGPWNQHVDLPNNIPELFSLWWRLYPGGTPKNSHLKRAWNILPKLTCWQLWLERNRRIFRDQRSAHKIIWIKSKALLKECIGDQLDGAGLRDHESDWWEHLELQFSVADRSLIPLQDW